MSPLTSHCLRCCVTGFTLSTRVTTTFHSTSERPLSLKRPTLPHQTSHLPYLPSESGLLVVRVYMAQVCVPRTLGSDYLRTFVNLIDLPSRVLSAPSYFLYHSPRQDGGEGVVRLRGSNVCPKSTTVVRNMRLHPPVPPRVPPFLVVGDRTGVQGG